MSKILDKGPVVIESIFTTAVYNNKYDLVEFLLNRGISGKYIYECCLNCFKYNIKDETFSILLTHLVNKFDIKEYNMRELMIRAITHENTNVMNFLAELDYNYDFKSLIEFAKSVNNKEAVVFLSKYYQNTEVESFVINMIIIVCVLSMIAQIYGLVMYLSA